MTHDDESTVHRCTADAGPGWDRDWYMVWTGAGEVAAVHARLGRGEARQLTSRQHPSPSSPIFAVRSPSRIGSRLVESWMVHGPNCAFISMNLPDALASCAPLDALPLGQICSAVHTGWNWVDPISRSEAEDWFASNRPNLKHRQRDGEIWWFAQEASNQRIDEVESVSGWDALARRITRDGCGPQGRAHLISGWLDSDLFGCWLQP